MRALDVAADTEIMDLTEESKEAQEEHARLLKKVETERRARTIAVPTKSEDVAKKLRYYWCTLTYKLRNSTLHYFRLVNSLPLRSGVTEGRHEMLHSACARGTFTPQIAHLHIVVSRTATLMQHGPLLRAAFTAAKVPRNEPQGSALKPK